MTRERIYEGHSTAELPSPRPAVWEWLRSASSGLYWHPHCIEAHKAPESSDGVGERHVLVSQHGAALATALYEIVDLVPAETVEFRNLGVSGSSFRIDLLDHAGGTLARLTVRAQAPKRSFRRWEDPTPGLNHEAELMLQRIRTKFD